MLRHVDLSFPPLVCNRMLSLVSLSWGAAACLFPIRAFVRKSMLAKWCLFLVGATLLSLMLVFSFSRSLRFVDIYVGGYFALFTSELRLTAFLFGIFFFGFLRSVLGVQPKFGISWSNPQADLDLTTSTAFEDQWVMLSDVLEFQKQGSALWLDSVILFSQFGALAFGAKLVSRVAAAWHR